MPKLIPITCRVVFNDQWISTGIDSTWKISAVKHWILARCGCTPEADFGPLRPVSPITFASSNHRKLNSSDDGSDSEGSGDLEEEGSTISRTKTRPLLSSSSTHSPTSTNKSQTAHIASQYTLISYSTGQILEDDFTLAWYKLHPHELLELHHARFIALLAREILFKYVQPHFEANVRALRIVSSDAAGPGGASSSQIDLTASARSINLPGRKRGRTRLEWRDRFVNIDQGMLGLSKRRNDRSVEQHVSLSSLFAIRSADGLPGVPPAGPFVVCMRFGEPNPRPPASPSTSRPRPSAQRRASTATTTRVVEDAWQWVALEADGFETDHGVSLSGPPGDHAMANDIGEWVIMDLMEEAAHESLLRILHRHARPPFTSSYAPNFVPSSSPKSRTLSSFEGRRGSAPAIITPARISTQLTPSPGSSTLHPRERVVSETSPTTPMPRPGSSPSASTYSLNTTSSSPNSAARNLSLQGLTPLTPSSPSSDTAPPSIPSPIRTPHTPASPHSQFATFTISGLVEEHVATSPIGPTHATSPLPFVNPAFASPSLPYPEWRMQVTRRARKAGIGLEVGSALAAKLHLGMGMEPENTIAVPDHESEDEGSEVEWEGWIEDLPRQAIARALAANSKTKEEEKSRRTKNKEERLERTTTAVVSTTKPNVGDWEYNFDAGKWEAKTSTSGSSSATGSSPRSSAETIDRLTSPTRAEFSRPRSPLAFQTASPVDAESMVTSTVSAQHHYTPPKKAVLHKPIHAAPGSNHRHRSATVNSGVSSFLRHHKETEPSSPTTGELSSRPRLALTFSPPTPSDSSTSSQASGSMRSILRHARSGSSLGRDNIMSSEVPNLDPAPVGGSVGRRTMGGLVRGMSVRAEKLVRGLDAALDSVDTPRR